MPLRKLDVHIELPSTATGIEAKREHARALRAVLHLVEHGLWAAFAVHLHDSKGHRIGTARLGTTASASGRKELPSHGDRQQAAA